FFFFFQEEDGIRDRNVTGVQTCALPISNFMVEKLKQKIHETNQELYILKNYPAGYINTFSTFIGPNSVSKYRKDLIMYKDVTIMATESHSYSVFYNE